MKSGKILAAVGVAAGLTLAGVLPATASSPAPSPAGNLTAVAPSEGSTTGTSAAEADAQAVARLTTLSHTQTTEQIAAIRNAGGPVVTLRDQAGNVVAAYAEERKFTAYAISSHVYCGGGDACAWVNGGSSPYGFSGTGLLKITLNNTTKIQAGSNTTSFFFGSSLDFVAPNETAYVPNRNYDTVTRS